MRKSNASIFLLLIISVVFSPQLTAQEGFSDETRALYILDISKYVSFDESFASQPEFSIAILDRDDEFYWDVVTMARTRKFIQGKPVIVSYFREIDKLENSNVVFVNSADGFDINEVLKKTSGNNTLLISEGYPFRSSMINFLVVDGNPRFEANEALMNQEGLYVDEKFLMLAVKSREDWEQLFEVTEVELEEEKVITAEQRIIIDEQLDQIRKQDSMILVQKNILQQLLEDIKIKQEAIEQKTYVLSRQEKEIANQKGVITKQVGEVERQKLVLGEQEEDIRKKAQLITEKEQLITEKESRISRQDDKIVLQAEAIQKQKIIIWAAAIALLLVFGLAYFIYVNYRNKKRAHQLLEEKNIKITAQKEEIEKQKELAEFQRDQIAYQKKHITDSIEYAEKIQTAILPSLELFSDKLEHFVLYKPRDIVSGDFYWVATIEDKQIIIAADCTGHGVPGAFMSMLGISQLNEIISKQGIIAPHEILNHLRQQVIYSLNQSCNDCIIKDGMDMTVCVIDHGSDKLYFSGANNPLYHIRNGELTQIKGDKMPVAIHEIMHDFQLHELDLKKGDTFYTFSDGFVDQFGGPNQKKYLAKNFRTLLLDIQDLSMIEQGVRLDKEFETYREGLEQIDDVVVIGVRY